jgi:hypothetical protein
MNHLKTIWQRKCRLHSLHIELSDLHNCAPTPIHACRWSMVCVGVVFRTLGRSLAIFERKSNAHIVADFLTAAQFAIVVCFGVCACHHVIANISISQSVQGESSRSSKQPSWLIPSHAHPSTCHIRAAAIKLFLIAGGEDTAWRRLQCCG